MSIFTNIILFTYASEQIDTLIPSLRKFTDDPAYSVLTCFTIEHLLIFLTVILKFTFDKNPYWVDVFFERRKYKREEKKYGQI